MASGLRSLGRCAGGAAYQRRRCAQVRRRGGRLLSLLAERRFKQPGKGKARLRPAPTFVEALIVRPGQVSRPATPKTSCHHARRSLRLIASAIMIVVTLVG